MTLTANQVIPPSRIGRRPVLRIFFKSAFIPTAARAIRIKKRLARTRAVATPAGIKPAVLMSEVPRKKRMNQGNVRSKLLNPAP